ncbi:MAG: hypothetical protein MJ100_03425 [Ruminococcus sp.]|nr:hypothetical protein [Ruminococcus sp.]
MKNFWGILSYIITFLSFTAPIYVQIIMYSLAKRKFPQILPATLFFRCFLINGFALVFILSAIEKITARLTPQIFQPTHGIGWYILLAPWMFIYFIIFIVSMVKYHEGVVKGRKKAA